MKKALLATCAVVALSSSLWAPRMRPAELRAMIEAGEILTARQQRDLNDMRPEKKEGLDVLNRQNIQRHVVGLLENGTALGDEHQYLLEALGDDQAVANLMQGSQGNEAEQLIRKNKAIFRKTLQTVLPRVIGQLSFNQLVRLFDQNRDINNRIHSGELLTQEALEARVMRVIQAQLPNENEEDGGGADRNPGAGPDVFYVNAGGAYPASASGASRDWVSLNNLIFES